MAARRAGKAVTVAVLCAMLGGMVALVSYSETLYRIFCQATGYGGTTKSAAAAPGPVLDRTIAVSFNTDIEPKLPWRFTPAEKLDARVGEPQLAIFHAKSLGALPLTGTATFNVTPAKAGQYFVKIDCFCFTSQTLKPGETAKMPVQFYIDPAIAKDRNLDDVTQITLSYTFFKALKQEDESARPQRTTENRTAPRRAAVN